MCLLKEKLKDMVPPYIGVWVEIVVHYTHRGSNFSAPLLGAWIEIPDGVAMINFVLVAPCIGAQIEISLNS
ncbi:hypothetical protein AT278_30000 [Bacillus cereus]|nr:hypothetical protein AT278_30000 [Bacillus cereus]